MYSEKSGLHKRQKLYKQGNLRTIALDVTSKCNMKCTHCYAETFANVKPVELNVLQKTLHNAYEMGVMHYVLQGGEPTVDLERLEAIINMCYPAETYINVISNGWNMNMDKILWLKDLKVDKITFSLDSGLPQEHDKNRLPGSYDRVVKAVDNVIEAGLLAGISIVVTNQSLYTEGFKKAYDFAINRNIRMHIQIAEPVGKWDGVVDHLLKPGDSDYIRQLERTCQVLSNGQKLIHRDIYCGDKSHCPAVTEFMSITADGQLLPCNFLQFSAGSIREKGIVEMRNSFLISDWFDNSHSHCICGEDSKFITEFIMPFVDQPKPLDAYKIFNLR